MSNINEKVLNGILGDDVSFASLVTHSNPFLRMEMIPPQNALTRTCLLYDEPIKGFEITCKNYPISAMISVNDTDSLIKYMRRNVFCELPS